MTVALLQGALKSQQGYLSRCEIGELAVCPEYGSSAVETPKGLRHDHALAGSTPLTGKSSVIFPNSGIGMRPFMPMISMP